MKSIKQILEADLKDNEASYAEYLAIVEFAKPYEGKKITRAIGNKLPAGYKLTDGHFGLDIVAPSGRKHYFVRSESMNNFTLKSLHDHDTAYSQGAPDRIEKLKGILNDPKKLKRCEDLFSELRVSYEGLKKMAKKAYDGDFDSFNNPAFHDILKEYKISHDVISDLNFDKGEDKFEKGGTAGEVAYFKDEGDFYTLKLTKDGKLPEDKMYPFGELVPKHFNSKTEAEKFAKDNGWKTSFDFEKGGTTSTGVEDAIKDIKEKYNVTPEKTNDPTVIKIVSPYFNTLLDINKKEFKGVGLLQREGKNHVLFSPSIYAGGGKITSRPYAKGKEMGGIRVVDADKEFDDNPLFYMWSEYPTRKNIEDGRLMYSHEFYTDKDKNKYLVFSDVSKVKDDVIMDIIGRAYDNDVDWGFANNVDAFVDGADKNAYAKWLDMISLKGGRATHKSSGIDWLITG